MNIENQIQNIKNQYKDLNLIVKIIDYSNNEKYNFNYHLDIRKQTKNRYNIFKCEIFKPFNTFYELIDFCQDDLEYRNKQILEDKKRKEQLKIEKNIKASDVKVNDVFISTFSYDNTYVTYYQVTKKDSLSTIYVKEIHYITVEETSMYSDKVVPDINNFVNDEEKKVRLQGDFFKSEYGRARKLIDINKPSHRSWGY